MSLLTSVRSEPATSDTLLLEDLISPLEPARFFDEHWERKRLYVERGDPGFYRRLFTLDDVDRALHVARSCPEDALSLAYPQSSGKERVQLPAARISREQIYRAYSEGATVRLGGVDRFWPPLALFRAALSERLSAEISINFYLTPPSSQGYVAHFDYQDAFILQLHGSKRWHLGEPMYELPGYALQHVSGKIPRQTLANTSPHLSENVLLRAGDLLYLPRGVYHKPMSEDESSLHLTVGIHPVFWGDLLTRAVEFVALNHLPLRKGLPPGFARDPEARRGMAETFAELLQVFAREAPFEESLQNLIRERCLSELYPADGHFTSLDRLDSLDPETLLEKRLGLTCTVETRSDSAVLHFGPSSISGPRDLAPVFEFIRASRSFRVGELPDSLSDSSKAVLARRLIREGLLRLAAD
jgi:ribosomal protein L16 Arg81 hydroxylase